MKIHVVVAQRKCSYPGEHAPEVLDACDEYCVDENPSWLADKLAEHRRSTDFTAVEVLVVRVPDKAVEQLLNPPAVEVEGVVESE